MDEVQPDARKSNEYGLISFKREYRSPEDTEGTLVFQPIKFYELNEDGSFDNGTTLEEMLAVCIKRLGDLNGRFPCRENSLAITKMQEALMWLNARTEDRIARGVEGKHIE